MNATIGPEKSKNQPNNSIKDVKATSILSKLKGWGLVPIVTLSILGAIGVIAIVYMPAGGSFKLSNGEMSYSRVPELGTCTRYSKVGMFERYCTRCEMVVPWFNQNSGHHDDFPYSCKGMRKDVPVTAVVVGHIGVTDWKDQPTVNHKFWLNLLLEQVIPLGSKATFSPPVGRYLHEVKGFQLKGRSSGDGEAGFKLTLVYCMESNNSNKEYSCSSLGRTVISISDDAPI
jgi:hypothetical protein